MGPKGERSEHDTVQDEEWRQQLLREQERDRQQAILGWHMEMKVAREEAERRHSRDVTELGSVQLRPLGLVGRIQSSYGSCSSLLRGPPAH